MATPGKDKQIPCPNEGCKYRLFYTAVKHVQNATEPTVFDHNCTIPGSGRTALTLILTDADNGIPRIYCQDDQSATYSVGEFSGDTPLYWRTTGPHTHTGQPNTPVTWNK